MLVEDQRCLTLNLCLAVGGLLSVCLQHTMSESLGCMRRDTIRGPPAGLDVHALSMTERQCTEQNEEKPKLLGNTGM